MNNKIKKIYISAAQKAALIEFMDVYPQLLAGKYTNTFTQHDAKRLWEQIALDLNSMPGSSKTWNQWRKTWKDIKSKTKPKQAAVFRHGQIRSGGPPIKNNMHQGNERVPELIHPIAIQEDIRVPESSINVDGHFTLKTELEIVDHDYGEYDGITYNTDQKNFQEIPKEEKKEHTTLANNKTQTKLNVATTTTLAEQNDEFNLKKKYYEDKLQLLRENTMVKKKEVLAKQRIADALEKIAKCLKAKHQVIANLANFAYDPINYELFKRLRIVDLFLEQLSSSDQDYLEYAVAGLANISADSEFAEYLITHNVINILLPYLDHQDEEIIMNVLILLIQLITPETSHLVLTPETISKVFALQFQDQRIKNLKTIFLEDYCTAEQLKLLSS